MLFCTALDDLWLEGISLGFVCSCGFCDLEMAESERYMVHFLDDMDDPVGYLFCTCEEMIDALRTNLLKISFSNHDTVDHTAQILILAGYELSWNGTDETMQIVMDGFDLDCLRQVQLVKCKMAHRHVMRRRWTAFCQALITSQQERRDLMDCWSAWTCLPNGPEFKRARIRFEQLAQA